MTRVADNSKTESAPKARFSVYEPEAAPVTNKDVTEKTVTTDKLDFFDLDIEEAEKAVGELCGKAFHGKSFVNFVYKHLKSDIQEMLSIPQRMRDKLKETVKLEPLKIIKRSDSADGTVKFLFEVETCKGPQEIESVYIPMDGRVTLCVSSQVGCKMACDFCLTGQLGYTISLKTSDIIRQVWTVDLEEDLQEVTNIVFMGMGEPFDNIDNVRRATRILSHHRGFHKSARKITVSTVGLVNKINELTKEDPFRLAVSLNASEDETRSKLMPVNRRWPIKELLDACHAYAKRTNKKVTFEYILMAGVTDRAEDAERLHKLMAPLKSKINLIPYNENQFTEFKRPTDEKIAAFHHYLETRGHNVFIRKNRGNDIYAACGMLKKVTPKKS